MWKLLVGPQNLVSMHEVVINCSPRNFKRINGKLSEYQPHSYLRLQHDRGFTTGFDRMQEMALLGPQNSLEINCIDFGCLEASGKKKPFIWISPLILLMKNGGHFSNLHQDSPRPDGTMKLASSYQKTLLHIHYGWQLSISTKLDVPRHGFWTLPSQLCIIVEWHPDPSGMRWLSFPLSTYSLEHIQNFPDIL